MLNQINMFPGKIKVKWKLIVCLVFWVVNCFGNLKLNYVSVLVLLEVMKFVK